jgi:hypothetical protein
MQSLWHTEQELGDEQFPERKAEFETKVNLSKEESIEAMSPLMNKVSGA